MPPTQPGDIVQDALRHFYELQHLQTHPLALELLGDLPPTQRGQALHRGLGAAIERLRPPAGTPRHALAWRHYQYLTLRYVHALTLQQVAGELGITDRHCRRMHRGAVLALADELLARRPSGPPPADAAEDEPPDWRLESELLRIDSAREPPASLYETVVGVTQTLDVLARASGVTLEVALDRADDVAIERIFVRQLLLNVLLYAIRRRPGGRIGVTSPPEGAGPGLDVVGRSARSLVAPVAGAGDEHLSVARHLARTHGARILIDESPQALRCRLVLPAASRSVLLIDDNPDFRQLFRRQLVQAGYQVREASEGHEAFLSAREEPPTVIILDVLMPGRDGWDTLQLLKNHPATRSVPVVVCSVLPDRELALALGASEFLPKPIARESLLHLLSRY